MIKQKNLPVEFYLTDEQNAELEVLVNALIEKCQEFEAPVMVAICIENKNDEKNSWRSAEAHYFNGERTPDAMAVACKIVEDNINSPIGLLSLISG